jgi:hypothetical protein
MQTLALPYTLIYAQRTPFHVGLPTGLRENPDALSKLLTLPAEPEQM